jgi:hypothetical protein
MKLFNKTIVFIMGISMMVHQLAGNASQSEEWCEGKWVSESGKLISNQTAEPNLDLMLSKWRAHEPSCGSTVTYITHLAIIQMLQRDFASAKATLVKVNRKSSYGYLVDSANVQLDIQEKLASNKAFSQEDYLRYEGVYKNIVKKHPNWLNGYALLGGVQTELAKHKEAIANLKKAESSYGYDHYYVYRNLTISYAALNQNRAALDAADKAAALNKNAFADIEFVIAYANVSIEEGYLGDAQNALKVLLAKQPEVENNVEFVKAAENFRKALDKQK